MSEILGFEKEYASEIKEKRTQGFNDRIIRYGTFTILKSKLVPVRLKSESIGIEWLRKYCKEKGKKVYDTDGGLLSVSLNGRYVLTSALLSAAKKEAKGDE